MPFVVIDDKIKIQGLREEKIYVQKIEECLNNSTHITSIGNENNLKLIKNI